MSIKCRKSLFILLICLLMMTSLPTLLANSGPPANVQITIINYEVDFSFDFLIHIEAPLTQDQINEGTTKINDGDFPLSDSYFPVDYASYQDDEGYVSNALYGSSSHFSTYEFDDHQFLTKMWMTVPRVFKLLLCTSEGKYITSEIITMSQFDFRLTYDLSGVDMSENQTNVGFISGYIGNPWKNVTTWVNFFLRLVLTLAIELGILFLFGFRIKATYLLILGMNVITQIALNIVVISEYYTGYSNGYQYLMALIVGEMLVFLIEAILVTLFIKEHKAVRKLSYSLLANTVSLFVGLLVASWLSFQI